MGKQLNLYHQHHIQVLLFFLTSDFSTNFHSNKLKWTIIARDQPWIWAFPQTTTVKHTDKPKPSSTAFFPLWSIKCLPKRNIGKWSWIRSINWNKKNLNFHYSIFYVALCFFTPITQDQALQPLLLSSFHGWNEGLQIWNLVFHSKKGIVNPKVSISEGKYFFYKTKQHFDLCCTPEKKHTEITTAAQHTGAREAVRPYDSKLL